jgi:hypothetical protein
MPARFQPGDLVRISKNLGVAARFLHTDAEAIVEYSYAGKYGGLEDNSYSLYIKAIGRSSWYDASHLTLIESGRHDLLEAWRLELKNKATQNKPG